LRKPEKFLPASGRGGRRKRKKRGAPLLEDLIMVPTVPVGGTDYFQVAALFLYWAVLFVGLLSFGLYVVLWIIHAASRHRERPDLVRPRH
jgi:hypothetical protein